MIPCSSDLFRSQVQEWKDANIIEEVSWNKLSPPFSQQASTKTYIGVPKMSMLSQHLAQDLDITYEALVESITRNEQTWEITTQDGNSHRGFHWVIVNCPPAQAQKFTSSSAGISEKISQAEIDPCWTVALTFESSLQLPYNNAAFNQGILKWISNNSMKPQRVTEPETWVLHASAQWSTENLELAFATVGQLLKQEFFNVTKKRNIEPISMLVHRWRFSTTKTPLRDGFLIDDQENLGVCGDWCLGYTIEDAFLSGTKLSEYLIARSAL